MLLYKYNITCVRLGCWFTRVWLLRLPDLFAKQLCACRIMYENREGYHYPDDIPGREGIIIV